MSTVIAVLHPNIQCPKTQLKPLQSSAIHFQSKTMLLLNQTHIELIQKIAHDKSGLRMDLWLLSGKLPQKYTYNELIPSTNSQGAIYLTVRDRKSIRR